jgi:hypothetical protein
MKLQEGDIEHREGAISENYPWILRKNVEFSTSYALVCKHCRPVNDELSVCPFVVIAFNEGGFCETEVCAECIVEAMKG